VRAALAAKRFHVERFPVAMAGDRAAPPHLCQASGSVSRATDAPQFFAPPPSQRDCLALLTAFHRPLSIAASYSTGPLSQMWRTSSCQPIPTMILRATHKSVSTDSWTVLPACWPNTGFENNNKRRIPLTTSNSRLIKSRTNRALVQIEQSQISGLVLCGATSLGCPPMPEPRPISSAGEWPVPVP
jgi:hypothetical protein